MISLKALGITLMFYFLTATVNFNKKEPEYSIKVTSTIALLAFYYIVVTHIYVVEIWKATIK